MTVLTSRVPQISFTLRHFSPDTCQDRNSHEVCEEKITPLWRPNYQNLSVISPFGRRNPYRECKPFGNRPFPFT
jgi:hypothetical protein